MELYREKYNYFAEKNENLVVHLHVKINRYLLFIGKEFMLQSEWTNVLHVSGTYQCNFDVFMTKQCF